MIYYFDASTLVKAFSYEAGSGIVIDILNSGLPAYSSMVVYSEVLFALRRKRHRQEINEDELQQRLTEFEERWGYFNIIELGAVLELLRNRIIKYPLKALDAIHLASALWIRENIDLDCRFLCSDKELLEFAGKESLDIFNPEETV